MAYNWIYNTSNDNIYILILIIVILGLIIINFKLWSRKIDRFYDVQTGVWRDTTTGEITDVSSFYQQSISNNSFIDNTLDNAEINGVLYNYTSDSIYQKNLIYNNDFSKMYAYVLPNSGGTTTTSGNVQTGVWRDTTTGEITDVSSFYQQSISNNSFIDNTLDNAEINGVLYNYTSDSIYQKNLIYNNDFSKMYAYVLPNSGGTTTTSAGTTTTSGGTTTTSAGTTTTSRGTTTTSGGTTTTSGGTTTTSRGTTTTKAPISTQTPTTTKASIGTWISLTGNPVNVTQAIYDLSIVQGLNTYYNKINTGSILINDITYNYLSPSPFRYGNTNYNIIKDVIAFNNNQTSNPNDPNYIYIYVSSTSNTQTTIPQSSNTQTTIPQSSNTQTSTKPQTTLISTSSTQQQCITLPLCLQPPTQPQTTTYNNPLNPNFYISKEEQDRRNAWSQLDGNEESLPNTNGSNPTYQNDILYNPNNGGLLNNGSNQQNLALTYSTIGDYATLDSLGANLTDTIGGINSNLGYTVLDEQLGTFNKYSNALPNTPNPNTYDNTANYNTGMNPYTVNGVSSGTVSAVGNGTSGKYTQDNKPIFMQKDFEGVSNIFAPNIYISNPPLTEDGNPDISFQM